MTIPKIIHHIAPKDREKWHPLWDQCYKSWKKNFQNFEFMEWDEPQLDIFMNKYYAEFIDVYNGFPVKIMKFDFVRFCLLHHYGGIYADMDFYCYQNFYDDISDYDNSIVELLYKEDHNSSHLGRFVGSFDPHEDHVLENALMCSIGKTDFFYDCMKESESRFMKFKENNPSLKPHEPIQISEKTNLIFPTYLVLYLTGNSVISDVYRKCCSKVNILDGIIYNNHSMSYDISYKTKHMHTGYWTKGHKEFEKHEFNFYHDYMNGNYLKITNNRDRINFDYS